MRVRLQRADGISRGKRVEIAITNRLQNVVELFGRDLAQPRRKLAREHGNILGIRS